MREIKDIWFVVDHFHKIHGLAHTFLSIEFNDGRCISISFEARRVKGERYHPWKGLWRSYELYLLIGYERDLLGLRTNARGNRDYLFRAVTPPIKTTITCRNSTENESIEPEFERIILY